MRVIREAQVLSAVLYDHDRSMLGATSEEFLGSLDLPLDAMGVGEPQRQWY